MEGSSDVKLDLASDRGPGQKEEIKKWRGPVTLSLSGFQERGPSQKLEIRKWRGPVTSSLSGYRREDPARNRKLESGGVQ